ncbi:ATP-dependent DNA helicase [Chloropicon primus]|uniref:DNA 3'-5' helicase n=2 Tax=Chloropicon primus TaxID=1764295 RepID=A0A5B8MC99_9CHLO|nr:ATP-dependent DNA helicase [Chloropicon primus]UPQ96949.1 ATP-dependent DNA helicase [Chloropicon primus]|eukprot:QDZ17731.1 ATP-dependent DNA helicase [Chloropicon primus]
MEEARLRAKLVGWREDFKRTNGRDPRKEEIPGEQRILLRELTNLKQRWRRGDEEGATAKGVPTGGDDSDDDSHVSGSPERASRVMSIPRRSSGKLPGAKKLSLSTATRKRRPRRPPAGEDEESEGKKRRGGAGAANPGTAEQGPSFLGSLFTQVVDILEDAPKPQKWDNRKARYSASDPNNPRPLSSYKPRKKGKQNIYRKRFKGSGGYGKGSKKVTTSNFCQVSRTGRLPRGGGRRGGPSKAGTKRDFQPFDMLLDGDVASEGVAGQRPQTDEAARGGSAKGGVGEPTPVETEETAVPVEELREALAGGKENELVREHLEQTFGFKGFREGQLKIIQRILQGKSTLAIMPTGHGKSLLYQIPALVTEARAPIIVISPLLALMKDQMSKLPKSIPKGILCSSQTSAEALGTLERIRSNKIKIVFISPERLSSKAFLQAFQGIGEAPPFVCIDEAHCISEWGHTFRPAYFRLGRILYEDLKVKTVLALTATATAKTISSIRKVLKLDDSSVVKEMPPLRSNLRLCASELIGDTFNNTVLALLKPGGSLETKQSVIIYCNFQLEAELVAAHLYTNGVLAKAYHAKMTSTERDRIQDLFCKGKIRVVAATVAFGMGLDKHDVDAVVHSEMPRSVEEYVQQIGRAGRDGREATCHMFYSQKGYQRLRSLCHSDGTDESCVYSLLCKIFNGRTIAHPTGAGNPIGILPLQEASMGLDIREGMIETVLSFLEDMASEEDGTSGLVKVLQPLVGHVCDFVFFFDTGDVPDKLPLVEHIKRCATSKRGGHYTVELSKLAAESKMSLLEIQDNMRVMQRTRVAECRLKDPALCYEICHDPEKKRALAQQLSARLAEVAREGLHRLDYLRGVVEKQAAASEGGEKEKGGEDDAVLKAGLRGYFEGVTEEHGGVVERETTAATEVSQFMRRDMRVFIQGNRHLLQGPTMLTGRAIARIMQALSSPAFPASTWRRSTMWGRYMGTDFEELVKAANRELVWYKTRKATSQ